MPMKPLDIATLRSMADSVVDIELSDDELLLVKPYVESYLAGVERIASFDFTGVEPAALNPATYV
jgi:hypothetical protein